MSDADDLLAEARDALAYLRKNGIPSHIDDDVTERLRDSFEALDALLSGDNVVLPAAWAKVEQVKPGRPWVDNDKLVPELHSGGWEYDIRVRIGTSNVVEIDKFYGPLVAQPVRVSI